MPPSARDRFTSATAWRSSAPRCAWDSDRGATGARNDHASLPSAFERGNAVIDTAERLQRVESIEQIRRLKALYCDYCDEGYDADGLCSLFTDDGVWDGGRLGRFEGHARLRRFFENMPNVLSFAIHHVTNSSIVLDDDGQAAEGRWYLLQMATTRRENRAVWLTGRYVDRIVLDEGSWKFRHVSLTARFFSPHDEGWAETPFLDVTA